MTVKRKNTIKKRNSGSSGKAWIRAFFVAAILILLTKALVFEPFIVRSTNMGNVVLPGEIVIIGKSDYGARLPITLLSVPFIGSTYYSDLIELPVKRLPGFDSLKRFELVLFNAPFELEKPIDKRSLMLSRVVGLPGEEIELKNYRSIINDRLIDITNQSIRFTYSVQVESESIFQQLVSKYDLIEGSVTKKNIYLITCSPQIVSSIKTEKGVRKIEFIDNYSDDEALLFASNQNRKWNKKNFGPIHIPAKGEQITLNKKNIDFYKDIITFYEGNEVALSDSEIIINGLKTKEYTFKNDYFFILDDNRSDSKDSRYWGFLPKTHIIGKSKFVLLPASKKGVRSNLKRVLKKTI